MNKIDDTIDAKRKQAIRRPRTSLSDAIIDIVENLILSQESDPGTHFSLQEIEMGTGISWASVHWIAKFDLGSTFQSNKCTTCN